MQHVGRHDDERGLFHVGIDRRVSRRINGGTVHCSLERALDLVFFFSFFLFICILLYIRSRLHSTHYHGPESQAILFPQILEYILHST